MESIKNLYNFNMLKHLLTNNSLKTINDGITRHHHLARDFDLDKWNLFLLYNEELRSPHDYPTYKFTMKGMHFSIRDIREYDNDTE